MGRLSASSTISRSSPAMSIRISLRLGRYRRIMPFLFSLLPRRRLEYGSAKYVAMPSPSRSLSWWANSVPLSCVTPPRAPAGSGENIASCAPTLSPAVLPGTIPAMRNLVFLSTSVCRLHPAPITPSASQWPKPLRSPASGGRSEMGTRPGIGKRDVLPPPRLRRLLWPRGRARPAFTAMAVGVDPTVDGLRSHAHGGVVGEQDAQPAADGQQRPAATQPFGHPRPQAFA